MDNPGFEIAEDTDDMSEESRKIMDRCSGKPPTICLSLEWRAWELTMDFLDRFGLDAGEDRQTR